MKTFQLKNDFLAWRKATNQDYTLVPTMGNLHQGHLSLVRAALENFNTCVVSIFVNPLQFGEGEDFEKYPKTLSQDLEKLELIEKETGKNIVVFAPTNQTEIFPNENRTHIEVKAFGSILCDKHRPGHFIGVTTVVYQLFQLIRPTKAFFGQKDFQQFAYINKMTKDLGLEIELQMCPIVRDENGLALSSRNQYLSENDKQEAIKLSFILKECVNLTKLNGLITAQEFLKAKMQEDKRFQYLEILEADSLQSPSPESRKLVVAGAFIMGDTRLIDNFLISL